MHVEIVIIEKHVKNNKLIETNTEIRTM